MDPRHFRFIAFLALSLSPAFGDQVIMKDGTVYKGKIQVDTDKAVLIGNPPFDPTAYLVKTEDIEKIVYEEYHPNPPSERKRGFTAESRVNGLVSSSEDLSFGTAASFYGGIGFRVHPALELNGGIDWSPALSAKDPFSVSDGTTTRRYQDFWKYSAIFSARFYPFFQKAWRTEPYLTAGYSWSHQFPKASGDSLSGSGWLIGFGAIRPLSTHVFLESRFVYEKTTLDTVQFLGHEGGIQPKIHQRDCALSIGVSYRL